MYSFKYRVYDFLSLKAYDSASLWFNTTSTPDSTASSVPSPASSAEGLKPSNCMSPCLRVTCYTHTHKIQKISKRKRSASINWLSASLRIFTSPVRGNCKCSNSKNWHLYVACFASNMAKKGMQRWILVHALKQKKKNEWSGVLTFPYTS